MLQLRYFYESAKNESFAKTAKKYMVPLTSVSIAIKHLEEELGIKLFDRTSNSVALNEKGRRFYYSIKSMFLELDSGIIGLSLQEDDERQIQILAKTLRETVISHIRNFNKLYPNVRFFVDVNRKEQRTDKYDIIIDDKAASHEGFEAFDLCTFKVRVECLSRNPLCQRNSLTLNQLKNQPFITTCSDYDCFSIFSAACQKKGFKPNVLLECNDYTCRDKCVLSGMGLGVTFGNTSNSPLPDVQYLNISDFNEVYTASIYYKPQACFGNVKAFLDLIKKNL